MHSDTVFGCAFTYDTPYALEIAGGLVWLIATASMAFLCKPAYVPSGFAVPLMPWLASAAGACNITRMCSIHNHHTVFCSLFLLCTVPVYAFIYYAIFIAVLFAIYNLFGIHNAAARQHGCAGMCGSYRSPVDIV